MDTGDLPSSGTSRESQAMFWEGTVWVSIREKFVLSRNLGYKTSGGRHVAKCSSDSRVAYPEVDVQVRDLVRVVGIVAPIAPRGFSIQENFVLSSPRG